MRITLRQMRVFDAVAQTGSILRASQQLHMSQSAASVALKDFQEALGRVLFLHGAGRPVRITDEGRRIQQRIRWILKEVDDVEALREGSVLRGTLHLGATSMIAEHMLPKICAAFRRLHPEVDIQIRVATSGNLIQLFERMELETALTESFPRIPRTYLTNWREDELYLVVAPEHPLAHAGAINLVDLRGYSWCMREGVSSTTIRLRILLQSTLGNLPVSLEVNSNQAIRNSAIQGLGIACLPRPMVEEDIANSRLVRLTPDEFRFVRTLMLIRPLGMKRDVISAAFDAFLLEGAGTSVRD